MENDLHFFSQGAHFFVRQVGKVLPFVEDFSRRRLDQPEYGPGGGGFPASTFADQSQCFSFLQAESDVVYRPHQARGLAKSNPLRGKIFF